MERNLSGQSSPPSAPLLIPGGVGETFNFGTYDVHWKIDGSQTGRRFSVIHQLVAPRALVAPLHRHHREDEYSYVLTGTFGALPAIYQWPETADEGGLLGYGPSFIEVFRQRARMAAQVLRGAKTADLPIEQPSTSACRLISRPPRQ